MCSRTTNKDLCNLSKDCQWNSTGCVETIKKEHWINYINNATKAQAKIRLANSVRRKKKLAEPNNNFKTAINNRPISPKLSSIDIETVKRQTVKLLSEIQINYDRLGKEGDIIKAAELSRKRVDKMSLQISDIKDIMEGKGVGYGHRTLGEGRGFAQPRARRAAFINCSSPSVLWSLLEVASTLVQ